MIAGIVSALAHDAIPPLPHQIIGGVFPYTVVPGDNIPLIGAKFAVATRVLRETNPRRSDDRLTPGQILQIDNRHIVPDILSDGIVANIPQRMLFLFHDGKLVSAYPIAVGRSDPRWRTPATRFRITELEENPTWRVPQSIQQEMEEEGKEVKTQVDPGPDNPLGRYRIKIGVPGYAIHSTIAPASIYKYLTHGCVRLAPTDAEAFFKQAKVGMRGELVYEPVLMARLPDGRIFVEVTRDLYRRAGDPLETLHGLADFNHLNDVIDWGRVADAVKRNDGIARDVTAGQHAGDEVDQ